MDTISIMDEDPTLPIDFDQSTNILNFLGRDKLDQSDSRKESLLSQEGSISEADNKINLPQGEQATPERGTLREHEEIISKFKKENFGLKLRIYFLEERLQMAYEEDTEDVLKTNIELKVNIEQLKKEVTEKQQLLIKASKAIETITDESEKHIEKLKEEFTKQFDDMRDQLEEELTARDKKTLENEKMIEQLNGELLKAEKSRKRLEEEMNEIGLDPNMVEELQEKQRQLEEQHQKNVEEKDLKIKELEDFKSNAEAQIEQIEDLQELVKEKEDKIENLKKELRGIAAQSPERSNQHYEVLYNQLETQNLENENKIKELSKDLRKKSNLVEELKDYINKTDRVNKELRNSIHDKETEKHRSSMSLQEHIRWKLNNRLRDMLSSVRLDLALSNKEKEINRCHSQIGKLEELTEKLRKELNDYKEAKGESSKEGHEKAEAIAALKAELQEKDILSKKFKQVIEDKDKELIYFNNAKVRAEHELQNAIAQKNMEIQALNEQLKKLANGNSEKLLSLEDQCQKVQEDAQVQMNKKDKLIQRLTNALRNKDILIEELAVPENADETGYETPQEMSSQFQIIKKLRSKLKDMDNSLEATLDEKFKSVAEKDKEILEMKRLLREKDREIELLKANVIATEGVIKHLENINEEKIRTMEDLKNALEIQENSFKVSSETAAKELEGYQLNVLKLSKLLDAKEAEINEMQKYLIQNSGTLDEDGLKAIHDQIDAQRRMNQELMAERDTAISRNEMNKQKFIAALNSKDAQIRDAFSRMGRISEEKNDAIKQLKALVEQKNHEIKLLDKKISDIQVEMDAMTRNHQSIRNEKDEAIENLTKSGLEKDRIISELKERSALRSGEASLTSLHEMESLKDRLRDTSEQLQKKSDEANELKMDNRHLRDKLDNFKRSENIEITMKFDSMKTELDDREKKLQDARNELWEIRKEMDRAASLTESLQKKIHNLETENDEQIKQIEKLSRQCLEKEESLKNLLKELSNNKDVNNTLQRLQEQKHTLETAAKEQQTELATLRAVKESLEKRLADCENAKFKLEEKIVEDNRDLEASALEVEYLKREIHELKSELERGSHIPQRDDKPVGAGTDEIDSKELRDLLKMQIQEQQKLFKATEQERLQYLKLINELKDSSHSTQKSSDLDSDLLSISALRSQYEDSVRQNDALQRQLENEIRSFRESAKKSSENLPSVNPEIENLKRKLEESESWNRSLQTRLDQLLPRAGGVGASTDHVDGPGSSTRDKDAIQKLQDENNATVAGLNEQKAIADQLRKELEEKSAALEDTSKTLADLKVHYDRFAQLRNKEITTLTNNCEQAKRVIRGMEGKVASLHDQLQSRKGGRESSDESLRKQLEGISAVNDVLRKTLNEKNEELKQTAEKAHGHEEVCKRLERSCHSLTEDKKLLMEQMQEKNEQMSQQKKELDYFRSEIEEVKDDHVKLSKECEVLQNDRQVLRDLNERLRNKLAEVSQTYENLKDSNEADSLGLKEELRSAKIVISELRHENDEASAVTMRLRDEIRDLQESSHEVQRLADELKSSQNVNKALQKRLNEMAEEDLRRNALEPEIESMKRRMQEMLKVNRDLEEKAKFYERQATALQREYHREKEMLDVEKEALDNEIETLRKDVIQLNKTKTYMDSKLKEMTYESESYKAMIERLEESNKTKQSMIERFEAELSQHRAMLDTSTTMTPRRGVNMFAQTTPVKLSSELQAQTTPDNSLKEALRKRDAYIDALKKQIDFYKDEKFRADTEKKSKADEDSSNSNNDLIALHIAEMRELRKELEESIRNNNALRDHLEHRLSEAEKEAEKLKDPNIRASLLRENDNLRARLAENDIKIRDMKATLDKLLQDDRRSSGVVFEKDNQIKQLKMKLEKRNLEFERMQTFVPQETSSTVTSPIQQIAHFTQTTPIRRLLKLNKEVQVDTIALKSATEKKELEDKLKKTLEILSHKEITLTTLEQKNESLKDSLQNEIKLKSELDNLRLLLETKESLISGLQLKIKDLQNTLSQHARASSVDTEKRAANDELVALHISEMRKLKTELELSIKNNDELKSQLEHRLTMIEEDARKMQDPNLRLNLVRDNDLLRTQSIERQNAVLKQQSVIDKLMEEKKSDKENIKKLHQQIHNLNKVTDNLKEEVSLYDRLQEHLTASAARNQAKSSSPEPTLSKEISSEPGFDASLLQLLLEEIRNLRVQLQKSIDANISLKEKLEEQLGRSLNTSGFNSPANSTQEPIPITDEAKAATTVRRTLFFSHGTNDTLQDTSKIFNQPGNLRPRFLSQETPTKENGSPASRSYFLSPASLATVVDGAKNAQIFVRGKLEDYIILKNKLANCCQLLMMMQDVHTIIQTKRNISTTQLNELREELERVSTDLNKCRKLIDLMWTEENAKKDEPVDSSVLIENQQLKSEIISLKKRLSYQDKLIKSSLQRLEESNKVKGDLEHQIFEKLKTTHGTMIKASQNLEDKIVNAKTPPKQTNLRNSGAAKSN